MNFLPARTQTNMKNILFLLAALAVGAMPLRAQTTDLSGVRLGPVIANGPIKVEDLKGKVVVIEQWGIH